MLKNLFKTASFDKMELARLILRAGIGITFVIHGYPKITAGKLAWLTLGLKMKSVGISIFPTFFGMVASTAEFFGGVFLIVGFLTRPSAFLLLITMIVALEFLLSANSPYNDYSHPLKLIIVFLFIFLAGPDKYSIDYYIEKSLKR